MSDANTCLANAKIIDPNAVLCKEWICEKNSSYVYKFCHCQKPNPPQNPCPYGANTPVLVYDNSGNVCFCCCSCFAWGTPVAVPDGDPKPIQDFVIGDAVLAAGADLKWTSYAVEFSDGVPPGPDYGKTMFSVYYQLDGAVSSLVVTADHVFVLADGSLRRAEFLVPGKDSLMSATGGHAPVLSIEIGGWFGGVHHIATSETVATSVDGHLLNSKGIVTGDWALQNADIEGGVIVGANAAAPGPARAATDAFLQAHSHLEGHMFRHSVSGATWEQARHAHFKPYRQGMSQVPPDAMRFISKKQAADVYKNAVQAPVSSIGGQDIVAYLFHLFQGFYPDVNFRLEWSEVTPNAYSWISYGVPFVVLNGGLVRTQGVDYNTLAVIIGHELGHLYGGPPLSGSGEYSCEGQADYGAIIGVLRSVYWFPNYFAVASAGITGVEKFFNYIDPDNRKGVPGQTCDGLSTDCRLEAMRAGLRTSTLPTCAGGPAVTYLKLAAATAAMEPDGTAKVTLTFDAKLDLNSATHAQNYTFDPTATVSAASRVPARRDAAALTAALTAGVAYKVTVENVISATGDSLENNTGTVDVVWA